MGKGARVGLKEAQPKLHQCWLRGASCCAAPAWRHPYYPAYAPLATLFDSAAVTGPLPQNLALSVRVSAWQMRLAGRPVCLAGLELGGHAQYGVGALDGWEALGWGRDAGWLWRLPVCHGLWFHASRKPVEGIAPCHAGLSAKHHTPLRQGSVHTRQNSQESKMLFVQGKIKL